MPSIKEDRSNEIKPNRDNEKHLSTLEKNELMSKRGDIGRENSIAGEYNEYHCFGLKWGSIYRFKCVDSRPAGGLSIRVFYSWYNVDGYMDVRTPRLWDVEQSFSDCFERQLAKRDEILADLLKCFAEYTSK